MLRSAHRFLLSFLFLISLGYQIYAQSDSTRTHTISLKLEDGTIVNGVVSEETEKSIGVITEEGLEIKVPKEKITWRADYPEKVSERSWNEDLNGHRLFISPTGKNLKANQVYIAIYEFYELFFPFIGYGITDWFSVSGGVSLVPGERSQFMFFSPKLTFARLGGFSGSAGVLILGVPSKSFGAFVYGSGTFDYKRASLTLGIGNPIIEDEYLNLAIIMVGGEYRVSAHTKFISELIYHTFADEGIGSFGVRVFGKNFSGEFGFYYPVGSEWHSHSGFPFLPRLSLVYNF